MKTCFKCQRTLPRSSFYRHARMADGLLGKCVSCTRMDVALNRFQNLERYRAYDRERYTVERAARIAARTRSLNKAQPERMAARTALNNAVRDRRVEKPSTCSLCGERTRLVAHHDDYSKPLDVRWICYACHNSHHASEVGKTPWRLKFLGVA